MGNRIFTNGEEGKILTSVGNRIIKQPYEFGNAHDIRITRSLPITDMYMRCKSPISNINDGGFSIMAWINNDLSQGNYCSVMRFESASYIASLGLTFRYTDVPQLTFNKPLETTYGASTTIQISPTAMTSCRLATFNLSKTERQCFKDSIIGEVYNSSALIFNSETYNYLSIGRGSRGINSYENPSGCVIQFYRILIYNRFISAEEHRYSYNNRLGNDIQSSLGLVLDIRSDYAEILDFSVLQDGSDMRVGCRDYSGYNRHGEIMNLPAGTLQQKVDYANANLFIPFI